MDLPESFRLEDDNEPFERLPLTQRVIKKMGWNQTYHAQFRCPMPLHEQIEQYVTKSPRYRTKSEFFVDACFLLLDKLLSEESDGSNGIIRTQHFLDQIKLERVTREVVLEDAKEELTRLRRAGDVRKLQSFRKEMQMMFSDHLLNSPTSFTDPIRDLIEEADMLIQAKGE